MASGYEYSLFFKKMFWSSIVISRRIFVAGSAATLAGCQTIQPHGLSEADLKALIITRIDVGYATGSRVTYDRGANTFARTKLPTPQNVIAHDPANPGAPDPAVLDWGVKLKALEDSEEGIAAGRRELAQIVKQQAETVLLGKPGGSRPVRLALTILVLKQMDKSTLIELSATLFDEKSNAQIALASKVYGSQYGARARTRSVAPDSGLLSSILVHIDGSMTVQDDATIAAAKDAAQNLRNWLMKPT